MAILTSTEIEKQAEAIRARWLGKSEARSESTFDKAAREHWDSLCEAPEGRPGLTNTLTAEAYRAANAHRPMGPLDLAPLAALTVDEWGPHWLTKTREQRRTRARLLRYMRCPDPSGMDQPEESDWQDFPELFQLFQEQEKKRRLNR